MIDNICTFLTNRIRKEMPEVDDEKAEVIFYGLQNILGRNSKNNIIIFNSYNFRNAKRNFNNFYFDNAI